jgi:hypothetical protein
MTTNNSYATIGEYKAYRVARGQTASVDVTDDIQIDNILNAASRWIDKFTGHYFYPRMETRYYDLPEARRLWLGSDLLEVTTITNGDGTAISSSDYVLENRNATPYFAIKLKDNVDTFWQVDSESGHEQIITVLGTWGYHDDYSRAWVQAGTLAAQMAAGAASATLTAGHTVETGEIVKIDSEIMQGVISSTDTFTPTRRGDNGTTDALHVIASVVYTWDVMAVIKDACLQIATNYYQRRTGQGQMAAQVTAAGVVLTPQDIPQGVVQLLKAYQRMV